jgi:hypothetical protein
MPAPTDYDKFVGILRRDKAVAIMFALALLLIVLNGTAAAIVAARGWAFIWAVEASLALTGAFAIAGIVLGLLRSLRRSGTRHQATL